MTTVPRAAPTPGDAFEHIARRHGLDFDSIDGDPAKPHRAYEPAPVPLATLDAGETAPLFVGPASKHDDRRQMKTFVSTAERVARCPPAFFATACATHPTAAPQLREVDAWAAVARTHEKRNSECVRRRGV